MKTFKTYQEEIYLDEMAKSGSLTEDEIDKLAGLVLRGTGKLAKGVAKGAAKGGAKVLGWAAKKAIKTARERMTAKGQLERQKRQAAKAKERKKLAKVKQARQKQRKAKIKSVLDKVQRNSKPIPRPKGTGPGPITP